MTAGKHHCSSSSNAVYWGCDVAAVMFVIVDPVYGNFLFVMMSAERPIINSKTPCTAIYDGATYQQQQTINKRNKKQAQTAIWR